jgi:outer membrane protein
MNYILSFLLIATVSMADGITIKDSYDRALEYEANVQSNIHQTRAKKEEIDQSKSRLYPKLDLSVSGTAGNYDVKSDYYGDGTRRERYLYYKVGGQLPIYHPENFNLLDQAKLKYKYSDLILNQTKQELAFNVSDAYLAIIKAKNSLSVAKAYEELNKIKYEQIKAKYDKRLANKMDLLQSKVTHQESVIKVKSEKRNLSLAKHKFQNLTGIENVTIPDITLDNIDMSKLVLPFDKNDLKQMNLELKKSDINIDLTEKEKKNSKYGWYPKVDLSATAARYNATSRYRDYTHELTATLTVSMPIYDGGYTSSRVEQYQELVSAANEDKLQKARDIEAQYDEFIINLNTARENIQLYRETIDSAKLYLYATNQAYEHGLTSLIDVEDAKTRLFEAKLKLIDSVYNFMKSYTSLLNLYGVFDEQKLEELDDALF